MTSTETLKTGCKALGIDLTEQACENLTTYYRELVKWNTKMNLVAKAGEQEIIENHFLDSLILLPIIAAKKNPTLLDVGTGAGFPGLVLKTACRKLQVTLVEPRKKRVTFLRHIVRALRLDNVIIQDRRLEQCPEVDLEQHPCITSRAVSTISEFLKLVADYSPSGGTVICMKGPKAEEEIKQWHQENPHSPFILEDRMQRILPFSKAKRELILFRKK